jgi:hypothetical protein
LLVPITFLAGTTHGKEPANEITVEGTVVDAMGQPLAGTKIMLIPDGKGKPKASTADAKGEYKLTAPSGLAFDIVYEHPNAGMASVSLLSRSHDQHIHKVLFLGSNQVNNMTAVQIYDELDSLQRVAFLASFREGAGESIRSIVTKEFSKGRIRLLSARIADGGFPKDAAAILKGKQMSADSVWDKLPIKP